MGLNFTDQYGWDWQQVSNEIQGANFNGGLDIAQAGATLPLSTQLTGTGSFTKLGAGTVVLGANNTYSGTTTVSGGVLWMNSGALPAAGSIIAGGGTLDLGGNAFTQSGTTSINFSGGVVQDGSLIYAGTYTASDRDRVGQPAQAVRGLT